MCLAFSSLDYYQHSPKVPPSNLATLWCLLTHSLAFQSEGALQQCGPGLPPLALQANSVSPSTWDPGGPASQDSSGRALGLSGCALGGSGMGAGLGVSCWN